MSCKEDHVLFVDGQVRSVSGIQLWIFQKELPAL